MNTPNPYVNITFRDWYLRLSGSEGYRIKNRIMEECDVSEAIFYNWTSGRTPIRGANQRVIAQIAEVPHRELFPDNIEVPCHA